MLHMLTFFSSVSLFPRATNQVGMLACIFDPRALVGKSKLLDFPEREKEIAAATNHSDGLPFVYRVSNASPIRRSAWSTINSGMFSTSSSSFKLSSENRTRSLT